MFVLKGDDTPATEFWLEISNTGSVELRARKLGFATKTLLTVREDGVVFANDSDGIGIATDPDRRRRVCILSEKGFPESS